MALEGRVVHIADIRAIPDYALPEALASGRRTVLGVPLLREGAVLGTINLSRKRVQPYTERQIELVRTFADQAVIAMENARLLGELQARTRDLEESLEYQTATSDVLKVISGSSFDIQPVFDTIIATAARLCGSDTGGITMREGEVFRYVSNYAFDDEFWAITRQRRIVPGCNSVAARVALEGRVVHVADIRDIPDYAQPETAASGRRTILGVPLLREGAVVGTIMMARQRVEPYHRAADRTGAHLCRPGGDRDRECAAARRIAGPHRRADPLGRRTAGARRSIARGQFLARSRHRAGDDHQPGGAALAGR